VNCNKQDIRFDNSQIAGNAEVIRVGFAEEGKTKQLEAPSVRIDAYSCRHGEPSCERGFLAEITDQHNVGVAFVDLGVKHVAAVGGNGHALCEIFISRVCR
jgi:hypothetical protein